MKKWHLLKAALLLGFILAPPASLAFESAVVSTEHVTVTLVSEQSNIEPGQTFWIGLHFELIPHWHIYWRNPGASGSAPVIRWTLPEGWEAWFRNVNDQTIEGIRHKTKPFRSVQFHPEAAGGPRDTSWILEQFVAQVTH